ncbi:LOW QUALITY PROTEIN: enteropeptidase-like [Diadema antillarum]|uniref:LOW QUALITY PROTEIN: enteropeptidase-like n=1 Tax=Diadema antillarum TaxID=105358 RepID=UPI003A89A1C1
MDKLCDGVSDCLDQSDESNCTEGGNQTIYLREHPNGYNLTSPNYPEYYPLNAQRTWLIVAEDGFRPRVDVLDLYTEPNLDVLYLSSSPTEAPLVLSGALTRTSTITYLSSNESLYARFVSDFAVSARGFLAIVTSESANNALACMSGQYDCGDGSVCMPSDQKCSCPVQPASCTTPTDCFPCNSGKCLPFSQQCDGTRQCEFGEDERNCTIQCNQFLCFEGICIDNSSICDMVNDCVNGEDEFGCNYPVGEENVTLSEGDVIEITSLGYPAVYDNNVYYTWILHAASARKVHIKFLQFRTHDANDFVLIGDGAVAGSNPFLRLYGSAFVPDKIVSQSTSLWITMVTDESFVSDGFRANVSTVPSSYTLGQCADSAMRCGDQCGVSAENLCDILPHCVLPDFDPGCPARIELGGIGSQHVSITSPFLSLFSENFPGRYGSLIDATLYLTAPAGQGVLVALRQFDVEGDYDFVRIYEGHGRENLLATLTGLVANQVIVSTGNEITIVFESDEIQAYFGFWMEIEAKDTSGCADDEFSCSNGQCRPASVECNGLIDCIDFTDEELCPTCSSVPSECSNILPWNITIFPNARFASEAEAIQYYADVTPSFNCHASARFLACAAAFPECPYYGNTRTVCLSVCDDVLGGGCEALQDVVDGCSGDTVVETVDGTVLCEARGGDLFNTSICGTRPAYDGDGDFQARIIGGTHAQAGEFPWLGSLRNQGDHICGATLVNERWAITAAHCTGEYDEIVFGDLKIDVASNYTASPTIARIRDHPQYVSTFEGDDISLIEFSAPIVFSEYVRPICLPMPNVSETMAYRRCYAAGWGATVYEAGTTNNELLKVLLPLMENDECSRNYENIIPSKICAGYRGGGYDACQGDSGGPLACEGDDGRWHLVGITSYGNQGCGDPGYPGVYTRVSSYLGFIQQSIS